MRTLTACALASLLALPLLHAAAPRPAPVADERHWPGVGVGPDGTEIQLDLPEELHQQNTGGSDGAGLCVYASARHTGRWCDEPVFAGMFDWMRSQPGGSHPTKFARSVSTYARLKGLPEPHYLSIETADLDALELATANGYMPGVTVMNGAHMVSLVGARVGPKRLWVTLDNNDIHRYRVYTEAEFLRTHVYGGHGRTSGPAAAWSVINLTPGPPPVPRSSVAPRPPAPTPTPGPCPTPRP